jgi:hypothetical protein
MKKYAYFITTFQSTTDVDNNGWNFKYMKCKTFTFVMTAHWFLSDTSIQVATNTLSGGCDTQNAITAPTMMYFSQSHYNNNGTDITYLQEYDITSTYNALTNFNFRNGDSMVLAIYFSNNWWGTINNCSLLGGIISTSNTQIATCTVYSNTAIYINNVAGFLADPNLPTTTNYRIKVKFTGNSVTNTGNYASTFTMKLFANLDAYNGAYQSIFNTNAAATTGSASSTTASSCFWNQPGNCVLG